MAGNKRPRKAHKARPVNATAHLRAMNAVTTLSPEEVEQGAAAVEKALQAFIGGIEPAFHWAVMADALSVAEQLSNEGICSDLASRDKIRLGQRVLADVHAWVIAEGWKPHEAMHSGCRAALAEAIELHRIQLTLCDYSEYRRAIETVIRRMKAALAGSVAKGTTILEARGE